MTQEEKAKRYDEVVKEIKGFFEGKQKMPNDVDKTLELLFPELKEDNDEKIRKAIVSGMTTLKELGKETFATININDCISWLEKQGEQKSQGKSALEAINEEKVDNSNRVEPKDYNSIDPHFMKPVDKIVEEHNITGIGSKHAQGKLGEMIKNLKSINERLEQKPAWSEEDDYNIQCMIAKVTSDIQKGNVGRNNELIDWLKSLKNRVQPQNKWKESLATADLENSLCDNKMDFQIPHTNIGHLVKQ